MPTTPNPYLPLPEDDVDLVARRIIMRRPTWDACIALAERLRADAKLDISAMDVARVALEAGLAAGLAASRAETSRVIPPTLLPGLAARAIDAEDRAAGGACPLHDDCAGCQACWLDGCGPNDPAPTPPAWHDPTLGF